jgi:hypothetical protein
MIKNIKDNFLTGLITGMVSPPLGFYVFCLATFPDLNVMDIAASYYRRNVMSHVVSLSVLVNLALFFIFLKFNAESSARGILGATFLYGIVILILKFT